MSNLPLQSRPPKYPLGPKGLFGGMAMPAPFGGSSPLAAPFKAVPNNNLQPPVQLPGGPIHGPAVKNTLLDVPNPQPTGPTHSTLFNTHPQLPHGVNPYENVSSHPADNTPVHQGPGGSMSSVPYKKPAPAMAPTSTGVDYTTLPGSASRHQATGPSQLPDFSTLPGMKSPTQWQNHFPSQSSAYPSDARYPGVTGLPRTHASEGSYVPPQAGLPPVPSAPQANVGIPGQRFYPTPDGKLPPQTPPAPAGTPPMLQPNTPAYSGPFALHAQTPANLWTPEMHQQLNASMSPDTQLSMLNNKVRIENMNRDAGNKVGMRGFGGMGGNSPEVIASQKAMIDPLVAQNRQQETNRWMSPSDAKQLKLGGAKPVEQVTPSLDENSPFWAGEGKAKQLPGKFGSKEPGTTVVSRTGSIDGKPSRGSELIGAGAMAKLNAAGITAQDLAARKPGDATDLAFKQLQRESSTAQAKKLSEEGGGVSKARQYSDEQKDLRMLNHAQKHGNMGLKTVQAAAQRQSDRNERRADQAELANFEKVGPTAQDKAVARSAYAATPVGKSFDAEIAKFGGWFGADKEKGISEAIDKVLSQEETPGGRKAFLNYLQNHPGIDIKKMPGLKKKIESLDNAGGMAVPGSKKPAMPEPEKEAPKPSFGSTLFDAVNPPSKRQPGKPLYPGRFGGY